MKTLKEKFYQNAVKYSDAQVQIFDLKVDGAEYSKWNRSGKRASKICHDIFLMLKETNELNQIEEFMYDKSPYIRYLASNYCMSFNPKLAEKTLEDLIESKLGEVSFKALVSIKHRRKIPWTEDRYK